MPIDFSQLWTQVRLGEDSELELKEVAFKGRKIDGFRRDSLADELAAFGNSKGGRLVLGVQDDHQPQMLDPSQLDRLVTLVGEVCSDTIKPALRFGVFRVPVPGSPNKGVLLVEIPESPVVHRSPGGYFRRLGDAKRQMDSVEVQRLVQARGQSDARSTDSQIVHNTGVNTLQPHLWRRYSSSRVNETDEISLAKLKFVKTDSHGALRATVGGVLLASEDPSEWIPNAWIQAVRYRGNKADSNGQLDARDIKGPLDQQIRDAVSFVNKNQRVAAFKNPARTDVPQFSERAVFEAVVNAVVHRDYAILGSRIRLFMFDDQMELYSPGNLCNSMSTSDLRTSQFTRNELLASRLGQCVVGDVSGSGERQYFIERRGEGIAVIQDETVALAGQTANFELIGERELRVTLPAARLPVAEGVGATVEVRHRTTKEPLPNVHVVMIFPNGTWREAHTDAFGRAMFVLHTKLPMTVFCAAEGFEAVVEHDFRPEELLEVGLQPTLDGGSKTITNRTGSLAGIQGRLNPILDSFDRLYLYADNIAINGGKAQPVRFNLNEQVQLVDSSGNSAILWFREMVGSSCVFDYRIEK